MDRRGWIDRGRPHLIRSCWTVWTTPVDPLGRGSPDAVSDLVLASSRPRETKIGLGGRNLVKKIDLFFGNFFFHSTQNHSSGMFLWWNVSSSLRFVSSTFLETFFTKMFPLFTSFRSSKIFFVPQIFFSLSLRSEKFFLSWRKKFVYHGVMNKVFLSIERFKFRTKNQTSLGRCLFAE